MTTEAGARRLGDGPGTTILLIHGFTGSSSAWGARILEGLARGRAVLAVDLPGHRGGTAGAIDTTGTDPTDASFERAVDGLVTLLDTHGVERADWIGYSMGGRLAIAGAVRHPGRVRRLVVESASPGLATPDERGRRRDEDEALARRIERDGIEAFVDAWMELPLFATQKRLPPEVLEGARCRRLQHDPRVLARALRRMGTGSQPSYWEALPSVEVPTLLLAGALDTRYAELARRMADLLPNASVDIVPDVGHAIHLEGPGAWIGRVVSFLAD